MAQLSIPDQGSYLTLCTIESSEINNNKSIKWLQRVGGMKPIPNYFVSRDIETSSYFHWQLLPTACGRHLRLLDLVFIIVSGVVVGHRAPGVVFVLESYD